jgi:hypothetical protein
MKRLVGSGHLTEWTTNGSRANDSYKYMRVEKAGALAKKLLHHSTDHVAGAVLTGFT